MFRGPRPFSRRVFILVLSLALAASAAAQTTISGGVTQEINSTNASSLGTITYSGTGGTLQTTTASTFSNGIVVNTASGLPPTSFIDGYGLLSVFSGNIGGSGSLGLMSSNGPATLTLSGANTYSGGTLISNAATANFTNSTALGSGSITLNSGALTAGAAGLNLSNNFLLSNSGGGLVNANGFTTTLSGVISNATTSGFWEINGPGTIILTGANTYSAGTTVADFATVGLGNAAALGTGNVFLDNGTIQMQVDNATVLNTIQLDNGASNVIDANGNAVTFFNAMSDAGAPGSVTLTDSAGGGKITLSGDNSYSGGTTIQDDVTVGVTNNNALGTGNVTLNSGTLTASGSIILNNAFTLEGVNNTLSPGNGNQLTLSGVVGGSGGMTISGGGSVLLSGDNSYSGGTIIQNDGAVGVTNNNALGTGNVTLNSGTLTASGSILLNNAFTLEGVNNTLSPGNGNQLTLSGVVGGSGGMTISGGGSVVLEGANLYAGGTTVAAGATVGAANSGAFGTGGVTINGGTLQLLNNLVIANDISLSGANTLDTEGNFTRFDGILNDSTHPGSLTVTGAGTISLTNANTYTGGTTVTAGSLIVLDNATALGTGAVSLENGAYLDVPGILTIANAIELTGGNTLEVGGTGPATYSGVISGTGGLTLRELLSGVLVLSGANTYSGGTSIGNGLTVGIANSAAFGTGSVSVDDVSTLKMMASGMNIGNSFTLNSGNVSLDANGYSTTFSGIFNDLPAPTSLTIEDSSPAGNGMITLSGTGGAWSQTYVDGGTLRMGAAGVMPSVGALNIAGGTFDLNGYNQTVASVGMTGATSALKTGAGTLTVTGNYAGSGTLTLTPMPSGPNLNVTGAASISGQNLALARAAPGTYVILEAAGGVSGTFSTSLLSPLDKLNYSLSPDEVELQVAGFTQGNQSPNQASLGNALNVLSMNGSTNVQALLNSLSALNASQLGTVMNEMTPSGALISLNGFARAGSAARSLALDQRVAALRRDWSAGLNGGMDYYGVGPNVQYPLVAEGGGGPVPPIAPSAGSGSPWSFYAAGLYTNGRLDGINGASGAQPGYNFDASGGTMGADYRLSDNVAAGASLGYLGGSATLDDGAGASSNEGVQFGAYGAAWNETWHGSLYVGGAYDSFSTSRAVPMIGQTATASPNGVELNVEATGGYDRSYGAYTVTPYGALNYDRLHIDPYSESGSQTDLDVSASAFNSLRSTLGVKAARHFVVAGHEVAPALSAGWVHEYANQSRALTAELSGASFTTTTADVSRDELTTGVSADAEITKSVTAHLDFNGDFRSDYVDRTVNASVRVKF